VACSQSAAFSTHLSWSTLAVFRVPRRAQQEDCCDSNISTLAAGSSHTTPSDAMVGLGVDRVESTLAVGPETITIPRVYRKRNEVSRRPFNPIYSSFTGALSSTYMKRSPSVTWTHSLKVKSQSSLLRRFNLCCQLSRSTGERNICETRTLVKHTMPLHPWGAFSWPSSRPSVGVHSYLFNSGLLSCNDSIGYG